MTTVNPSRFGTPSRVRSGSKIIGERMSGLATIPAVQTRNIKFTIIKSIEYIHRWQIKITKNILTDYMGL